MLLTERYTHMSLECAIGETGELIPAGEIGRIADSGLRGSADSKILRPHIPHCAQGKGRVRGHEYQAR